MKKVCKKISDFIINVSINGLILLELLYFLNMYKIDNKLILIFSLLMVVMSIIDIFKRFKVVKTVNYQVSYIFLLILFLYGTGSTVWEVNGTVYHVDFALKDKYIMLINAVVIFVSILVLFILSRHKKKNINLHALIEKFNDKLIKLLIMAIELFLLIFFIIIIQINVYSVIKNSILFGLLGGVGIFITIIGFFHNNLRASINNFNNQIIKYERKFPIFDFVQSITFFFMVFVYIGYSYIWNGKDASYKEAFLTLAYSILITVILYWFKIRDKPLSIILIVINWVPIFIFGIYDQEQILGSPQFSKFVFAFILGLGAILLLVVSEDSQTINKVKLTDRDDKLRIAKYKMRVANGVIFATFANVVLGDKDNIVPLNKWLTNLLSKYFSNIDKTWVLITFLAIIVILIFVCAFWFTYLESRAFKYVMDNKASK